MPAVTILFIVLAAVTVFVIATVTVGREARRLDSVAPRAVYVLDTAVDFVADRLPPDTQARLTPEELEALLTFHLRWLHEKGLQPDKAEDQVQDIDETVVVTADNVTAYLLGEADAAGIEVLDDVDIVRVTDAHLAYFEAIGAVGPEADDE
jgi:hypothetical protein